MNVIEKVEKTVRFALKKKIGLNANENIVVGLSGGPDSVCLFDVLRTLSKEFSFTISAVHVNHKIRGAEADADENFVRRLCEYAGVKCNVFSYDCEAMAREQRLSTEEMGRKLRYDAFLKIAKEICMSDELSPASVHIVTAHNLNDQAETVLMRIIRGTGIEGLSGIPYVREFEGFNIIRPLLDVKREDIEEYCKEKELDFRVDATNSEAIYTRNKIRLSVLPLLSEFNPNIAEALARLADIAKEDKQYFARETEKVFAEAAFMQDAILFNRDDLTTLHSAVRRRVLKKALEELGLTEGVTALHLEAMEKTIFSIEDSTSIDLPKGYSVASSYGEIRIFKSDNKSLGHYSDERLKRNLNVKVFDENLDIGKVKDFSLNGNRRYAIFSLEKLYERILGGKDIIEEKSEQEEELAKYLQVRNRRPGDWIWPLGMNGRKKLQDLFVDEKVYKEQRDSVPLVCIGDEVIWIVGDDISGLNTGMKRGRISELYKVDSNSENIAILDYSNFSK